MSEYTFEEPELLENYHRVKLTVKFFPTRRTRMEVAARWERWCK
jgi:hypothetical protein